MKKWIQYFIQRPVVVNAVMFGMMLSALLAWNQIGKEEMPEFSMNWVRIIVKYPGASAEDVELFVIKPVEEKLKGITSLKEVSSTASYSSGSFRITFEPKLENLQEKIQEVKDAISSVSFPKEVEEPVYRQFRSSEKAIIDIGLYLKGKEILDVESRQKLQSYALAFKNKILTLPEISGVDVAGYLKPELQVKVSPSQLKSKEISLVQVKNQIQSQNIRHPIGSMKDQQESEISINSELNSVKSLEDVTVSSGFQSQKLKLKDIALVEEGFEESNSIFKVQGHEGIIYNIKKSASVDILSAQQAVVEFVRHFEKMNNSEDLNLVLMDDESYDVSNRLSLIGVNGLIGFILIVLVLFLFLDFRSGIWVAMGIPFSLSVTLIMALVMGYTVNNITLAAIIIVLGIVVDDAIIIAENISRKTNEKVGQSSVEAVLEMTSPVFASVLTTCAAFIPLYYFTGRFGLFVKYIPAIVILMLFASLVESFLILPSHIDNPLRIKRGGGLSPLFEKWSAHLSNKREKLIHRVEKIYHRHILFLLKHRFITLVIFLILLVFCFLLFKHSLKYVMFPREESRDFRVKVVAAEGVTKYEMARLVRKVEDLFLNDNRNIVQSVISNIGQNRRGGEVKENEATVIVEITPPSERKESLNELLKGWEKSSSEIKGFSQIKFLRSRFGSDSGSPIAIEVQENNDQMRDQIVNELKEELVKLKELTNVEIDQPVKKQEYQLVVKSDMANQLGINLESLAVTLRAYIQGDILYTLNSGEEEVDVRLTSDNESKKEIDKILELTVANDENYLVPLKNLITVQSRMKPTNIQREGYKRATLIYADIHKQSKVTPIEIAEKIEKYIFPKILSQRPSAHLLFRGEVEDSRVSESDFMLSITMVLLIIYVLLIFLFNSIWTPLLIGATIPFGAVGVILSFWLHGFVQYGFFAVIGTLGMVGVVINDAIVLVNKLEKEVQDKDKSSLNEKIALISSSRLRAIVLTTLTTVVGLFPTAYGIGGYDSMLAEMMLALGWGLLFGMLITLGLVPCLYSVYWDIKKRVQHE